MHLKLIISFNYRKLSLEVAPTTLAAFSSCDRELWPVTLIFKRDLDNVNINQHANYRGQMSFVYYI